MKKSVLKRLIKEVISVLNEIPDEVRVAGLQLTHKSKESRTFILSSDGNSGVLSLTPGLEHSVVEGLSVYQLKSNGFKNFNESDKDYYERLGNKSSLIFYEKDKFRKFLNTNKNSLDGRFFVSNPSVISFWTMGESEKIILQKFFNGDAFKYFINELNISLKDSIFDIQNFDSKAFGRLKTVGYLTYDEFIEYINNDSVQVNNSKEKKIENEISKLTRMIHQESDPSLKNLYREKISKLQHEIGRITDPKSGAGSVHYQNVAKKAGYQTPAEMNARQSFTENFMK